jgi:1-acyl-sn-glycerol-3-phosphate acyltransferase
MKAVKTALKCLKEGNKLLMFPEGTRVHEGEDVAAKTGAAMFATRTGVPLMPVYIQPKKKRFRRNTVVLGKPFTPTYAGRRPTSEELETITEQLMAEIHKLGEGQP